ncbi:hypothetical protein PMAYCL1PPCAC_24299, partial [Pristionchus mayeri]
GRERGRGRKKEGSTSRPMVSLLLSSTPLSMWVVLVAVVLQTVYGGVSPPQAITPLTAKSSAVHPLVVHHPLTLWCNADGIKTAKFVHLNKDKTTHAAKVTGNNATLTFDAPSVLHAGDYRCEMETKTGMKTETTSVYVRPVVHTELAEKLEPRENKEFFVTMSDIVLTEGGSFNITCPVFSHPLPNLKWTKDDKPFEMSARKVVTGDRISITDVTFDDEGVYACEAVNEFTVASKTMRPMLNASRKVSVKSKYAWVVPMAVIIVILLLLVIIIWTCEMRKKKREKRTATYLAAED